MTSNTLKRTAKAITVAAAAMMLHTACDRRTGLRPQSSGLPYEVVVTGDTEEAARTAAGIIQAITATALPQTETAYDVSVAAEGITPTTKYARSIVVADTGADGQQDTRITYERNTFAEPQLIVRISAPSLTRLKADSACIQRAVDGLLRRFETAAETSALKRAHNMRAEKAADSICGRKIWIAPDIDAMKTGRDFVWFSDGSATAMRNICVYSYPGLTLDAQRAVAMRDSVMGANIPGARPGMRMHTAKTKTPEIRMQTSADGRKALEMRGLWEMEGDAMGGPFVSRSITDSAKGRIVTAEAFVFAPGKKKRNIMRQLEAALYTLK